ncbi:MAG: hypothetical protein DMF49_02220 [Acidobacteria bacterium]|nr:MAG: hypothetical protein DMF49_02220 [Acidobacteriota bacterium]
MRLLVSRLLVAPALFSIPAAVGTISCRGGAPDAGARGSVRAGASPAPPFIEAAAAAGIDFVHFNGMSGQHYLCEMMGAGAALFDYDNDGDLDLFLVQGEMLGPGRTIQQALLSPKPPLPPAGRLYRNELMEDDRSRRSAGAESSPPPLRFTDVTASSGIRTAGYGMGAAAGDFDNDGWIDLYITNFGSNQLWRNNGDGTFTDLTARSGADDPRWSTSAAIFDFDRDGWLDLFVCNYVDFTFANHKRCTASLSRAQDYCSPLAYSPLPNRLLHNRGDGTFEDVSAASGIASESGGALGVVSGDFDGDGWPDLYVANDGRPNQLWINRHDGTFVNEAMLAGCALSGEGKAEAGMGVAAGDFDADGDEDLFVTNLTGESNRLYVNDGRGRFSDQTSAEGLSSSAQPYTGFGTGWIDFDNDGWLDLFIANGAVTAIEAEARAGDPFPLRQPRQLFRHTAGKSFEQISSASGAAFSPWEVGRGAAFGDLDNDGDMDIVVTNNNGPARLLINESGAGRHWIGLRLLGKAASRAGKPRRTSQAGRSAGDAERDMLGAWVEVMRPGRPALCRRARSDGSYLCSNDPRVLIGLGDSPRIGAVQVNWPDGRSEEWSGVSADRWTSLHEGTGQGR